MENEETEKTLGIDVSVWQKQIDWKKVVGDKQGVKFAFIRISDGLRRDKLFETNWINARAADPKFITGIYQYFDVHQDIDAQAQMVLEALGSAESASDGRTLPPVLDVEKYEDSRPMLSPPDMISAIYRWTSTIRAAIGVPPIIYTNVGTWDTYVKSAGFVESPLWVANYERKTPLIPAPWKKVGWDFWQYTASGKVDGVTGPVDMNFFRGGENRLRAFCERRC